MNEITTLFTAIGEFFTGSDWSQMVRWPFWILLFTIAAGGVYCARFGKKTLVAQSISGALNLLVIYVAACILYTKSPFLREFLSEPPFLSVSDQGMVLLNPLNQTLTNAASLILRLMILVLVVNTADSFCTSGKTLLTWLFFQTIAMLLALGIYEILIAGVQIIFPRLFSRYAIIPVVIVVLCGILMICLKFIFTVVITGGNPYYGAVYKFFTVNRAGSLITTSTLSFLMLVGVLAVLVCLNTGTILYSTVNVTGLCIILGLLMIALYIFGTFYIDRKKG